MKKCFFLMTCLLLTSSCSKVKELDKRTESMEKTTEKMSTTTDDMKDTTSAMYQQIRSKEAEDTRDSKFHILMGEEAGMGSRITAAGVFFRSLEFQLHTDNGSYDNAETLNHFYIDAANEFTRRMVDLYDRVNTQKMSPLTKDKMEMSFYAISAALHMNHTFHDIAAKKKNSDALSMCDMIKEALAKDHANLKLKEHEEILVNGINREIMIELFKARVDILSALALKSLTDKENMTLGQKAKALIFKITNGRMGEIELPEVYDKTNEATRIYIEKYLDAAVKAKDFLNTIGVEKPLEKTLKSAFRNIELNQTETDSKKPDSYKNSIKQHINQLLK